MPPKHDTAFSRAFRAALPVMLGYLAIGIPAGILESEIGLNVFEVFLLSATFYSGAGQFMLSNLYMAGAPLTSIIASISFLNTRQLLYSASFAPYLSGESRLKTFLFSASVTDESFGVNLERYGADESWGANEATLVNLLCMSSWALANVLGVVVGSLLALPTALISFAMTSIFICLLVTQEFDRTRAITAVCALVGVAALKLAGVAGPAILIGAIFGVTCGMISEAVLR